MLKVRTQRECSGGELVPVRGTGWVTCPECGATDRREVLVHRTVEEWMPLADAVRVAHEEVVRRMGDVGKT